MVLFLSMVSCSFSIPHFEIPGPIQASDLTGIWEITYSDSGHDVLVINGDGTYCQHYSNSKQVYEYSSSWLPWQMSELPSGEIRLQMGSGRYFLNGALYYEDWGGNPDELYDPFEKDSLRSKDDLPLVVVRNRKGELLLYHLWTSSDRGFPIIGGENEYFRRANLSASNGHTLDNGPHCVP